MRCSKWRVQRWPGMAVFEITTERSTPEEELELTYATYLSDHPGNPLGPGMPLGSPFRREVWHEPSQMWRGESHLMAWERIVRWDPCSYCGRSYAGTVDHIEPKTLPVRGISPAFSWANLAAACESCNGCKGRKSLLTFLRLRR